MGLGPAVVALRPSGLGRAPWPRSPSEGVQPDDCPDPTHCAAALRKPGPPQARSALPCDMKNKDGNEQDSFTVHKFTNASPVLVVKCEEQKIPP